tara:strand:+ start:233 stop:841 length:609 start_codon:yes stop_codon:yes gene_type:complete
MADISTFYPSVVGGGIPKYAEFTSNGTWTPPQALIDAGGRISYLVVGGGGSGPYQGTVASNFSGGCGGEVKTGYDTLTSTSSIAITIGAGGAVAVSPSDTGNNGSDSIAAFASAGGTTITSSGGAGSTSSANNGTNWGSQGRDVSGNNNALASSAHPGFMGIYGRGGSGVGGGTGTPAPNTGSGSGPQAAAADGFVRITWFE